MARRAAPSLLPAAVTAILLAILLSGCAGIFRSYDLAPSGLTRYDDGLRQQLVEGRYESALEMVTPSRATVGDELLRLQYKGLVAHYAGHWEESNAALQRAAALAEDRYTRSISRDALSLVTSDRVLRYRPSSTERLLLHYYGALNYLRLGDPESAAVEARLLSRALEQDADGRELGAERRELHAILRQVTGAVFEAAGERNDAEVAYRLAARAAGTDSVPQLAAGLSPDSGVVVMVVERGFVAHRVARSVNILLWPHEVRSLRGADASAGTDATSAATALAEQLLSEWSAGADLSERSGPRSASGPSSRPFLFVPRANSADSSRRGGTPYLLRVSWPDLAGAAPSLSAPRIRLAGDVSQPVSLRSNVSAAVAEDFRRQQPLLLAKSLLRALTKHAVASTVRKGVKEEDEALGELAGLVANAGLSLLEQADTRSWHLVPAELSVVRLRLPAGEQELSVEVPPEVRQAGRALEAGPVDVPAGGVTVLSLRSWR